MTTIQIYGRLGRSPESRATTAGKVMVTASMVVDLGRDTEAPEWFSLVAFGTISEALAKHGKGDMVAVSGKLTKSAWTGKDGVERSGLSVLVDSIASTRTVRPGEPKTRDQGVHAEHGGAPFDDPLRF